jgi:hypothetical protein
MYLNLGEQLRPDVHLILEGVGGSNLPPLSFNPDVDPVYLTHYPNWKIATLDAIPSGSPFARGAWAARFRRPQRFPTAWTESSIRECPRTT